MLFIGIQTCFLFASVGPVPNISNAREILWLLFDKMNPHIEQVWVLALDSQLNLIDHCMVAMGTVDSCQIHPRDVFRFVYQKNASGFILVHNHPSGNLQASKEDLQITKNFLKLSWLHEVQMLDHIILSQSGATSLRASKLIRYWNKKSR